MNRYIPIASGASSILFLDLHLARGYYHGDMRVWFLLGAGRILVC